MDYLDYLTDHDYDDLPPAVRTTIDRAEYTEQRELALMMREPEEGLPARLVTAFAAATAAETDAARLGKEAEPSIFSGRDAKPAKGGALRWLPWLAAAGWLFFLFSGAALLLREPETVFVEKTIVAPAPAPKIVTVTDTVYQTVRQIRYRTKHDTVYQEILAPPQIIYVRDTLYLPPAKPVLVKGSSNLSGKERVLDFLFSTD